ncbi:MAG: ankyrin repeat domain-containing protein [Deinococcales bacterium]
MNQRPFRPLALLTLLVALAPIAHALDAAQVAPAFESAFPRSVTYLDCPYQHSARTCVLVPGAKDEQAAYAAMTAFVHGLSGATAVDTTGAPSTLAFQDGDTAYRLHLAPSRTRPGAIAATLTYAFDRTAAFHASCQRRDTLFEDARRPSLDPATYATMATAIACHGADPVDGRSRTPLVIAVMNRNLDAVLTLLRGGADPNHITLAGWTPLLFAARSGTPAIFDALLQAGADPSYIAPDGATVETLEPFNPRLDTTPEAAAVAMPTLPAALTTVPTASGLAPGSAVPDTTPPSPVAAAVGGRESATAAGTGAVATVASHRSAPAAPTAAAPSAAAARSRPVTLPVVPLEILALAVVLALGFLRARRSRPGASPDPVPVAVTTTQTDLPAMPVPGPFRRQRADRRLDPVGPHDDVPH